jgi:hypothetical protein
MSSKEIEMDNSSGATSKSPGRSILFGFVLIIIALALLALLSYKTSFILWDGAYPSGAYRLKIQNTKGEPIRGAVLKVFLGGTQKPALGYPIDNYLTEGSLTSDDQGMIFAFHKAQGIEFGGTCRKLFWVYQTCSEAPTYDFEVSAEGCKTINFSTVQLFGLAQSSAGTDTTEVTLESGGKIQLPVYEMTLTMEN